MLAAQLLEANPQHIHNPRMVQPAKHFLNAETSIISTQKINILGKAGAGGMPPVLAQRNKTIE